MAPELEGARHDLAEVNASAGDLCFPVPFIPVPGEGIAGESGEQSPSLVPPQLSHRAIRCHGSLDEQHGHEPIGKMPTEDRSCSRRSAAVQQTFPFLGPEPSPSDQNLLSLRRDGTCRDV